MELIKVKEVKNAEIVHYNDGVKLITSYFNKVSISINDNLITKIVLKEHFFNNLLGHFRILRRFLRLDKCNIYPVGENLIIIRQGKVYYYDGILKKISETLTLKNCRNILHQSISSTPDGFIYFGEYGNNKKRNPVPLYRSKDGGKSWENIYTFEAGKIKHIHGCYYDKYEDKVWVCTGDFKDENWLVTADRDFKSLEFIGNGQQIFRTCNLIFKEQEVHWLMDSQLEESFHIKMNRSDRTITKLSGFPGPVWYIKEFNDGIILAGTANEKGEGVFDNKAHLFASNDLLNWQEILAIEHDNFPKGYFKFGVIGFPDGLQTAEDGFYLFFEALKKHDGKSFLYKLKQNQL